MKGNSQTRGAFRAGAREVHKLGANARDIKRLCLAKTRRRISCEARPPPGIVSLSHNYRESRFKVEFHLNKA